MSEELGSLVKRKDVESFRLSNLLLLTIPLRIHPPWFNLGLAKSIASPRVRE